MRPLSRNEKIATAVSIAAIAVIFYGPSIWNYIVGEKTVAQETPVTRNIASTTPDMVNISSLSGLAVYDMVMGTGTEAVAGKTLVAHYVGAFTDGMLFDSSMIRGEPYEFVLGAGKVIRGWELGLVGMKEGGIRRLVISPEYGYGAQPIGQIPANSTLIFEVQLVDVK